MRALTPKTFTSIPFILQQSQAVVPPATETKPNQPLITDALNLSEIASEASSSHQSNMDGDSNVDYQQGNPNSKEGARKNQQTETDEEAQQADNSFGVQGNICYDKHGNYVQLNNHTIDFLA